MSPRHSFVRLIASDLDGTFLRDDKTISGRTIGAVQAAKAAGIAVIAATGRQAQQLPDEIADSGVRHVVASNGAIGFDLFEDRVLFQDLRPGCGDRHRDVPQGPAAGRPLLGSA